MKEKRYIAVLWNVVFLFFVLILASCSPKSEGEIFLQGDGNHYIRNNSSKDLIIFTVQFESQEGILYTKQYRLSPGELKEISKYKNKYKSLKITGGLKFESGDIKI